MGGGPSKGNVLSAENIYFVHFFSENHSSNVFLIFEIGKVFLLNRNPQEEFYFVAVLFEKSSFHFWGGRIEEVATGGEGESENVGNKFSVYA